MGTVFFSSVNELATVSNTFSVAGVPTNPTAVTLTITSPTGVITVPTPTSPGAGVYTCDIACGEDGVWQYEWIGTGAASDAAAGTWEVLPTQLGRLYCTVEALKSRLGINHNNSDLEIHGACFAVSRWIEEHCERRFWRTTSTTARTFPPTGSYELNLPTFSELVSVTSLKTDSAGDGTFATTWTVGDYQLHPLNRDAYPETRPATSVRSVGGRAFPSCTGSGRRTDLIEITGVWGWPKVPLGIRQGALILAADTYKSKDTAFGETGDGEFVVAVGENRRALRFIDSYQRYPMLVA